MKVGNLVYDADSEKLVNKDARFNVQEFKRLANRLWNGYLKSNLIELFAEQVQMEDEAKRTNVWDEISNLPIVREFDLLP